MAGHLSFWSATLDIASTSMRTFNATGKAMRHFPTVVGIELPSMNCATRQSGSAWRQFGPCQCRSTPRPRRHGLREKLRRSEEHTSELQSLMRISYAVFCLQKKKHE